ncbi:cytochrome b [Thalassotalea sp. M1531]|uniref:Cytochrome b n=1 Tax=Thalassotalea algicola TaxID=2716224 RepID=A0A7Y0LAA7_9GAMM|nr:cytochrome b [Thalassotalea algicola]NMP30868.1 cytochrome b [Thalassotalea algicola]
MNVKDTNTQYGIVTKLFHWLSALIIIGLFGVGFWMVDLTYYSQWYKTAPHWHKSIGILLFFATVLRGLWKYFSPSPAPLASSSILVQRSVKAIHNTLYLLLLVIMFSGYLISTADGRAIEVFNWFSIGSMGELITDQEDIAGLIHEYLAYLLIGLASIHALAALKHHFIDKDQTLKRML